MRFFRHSLAVTKGLNTVILFYDRSNKETLLVWISVFHSSHSISFIVHKNNTSNVYYNIRAYSNAGVYSKTGIF